MCRRLVPSTFVAVALLWLAGCGPAKLNESKTWDMEVGDARAIDLPAQAKPQTITVEFTSSAGDIDILVFKEADAKGDDMLGADKAKAIAHKKSKGETFTADIPENTASRVVARGATGKTSVTLKVTNQK